MFHLPKIQSLSLSIVLAAGWVSACKTEEAEAPGEKPAEGEVWQETPEEEAAEVADAVEATAVNSLADLGPRVLTVAESGVVPQKIVVEFGRGFTSSGAKTDGTVIRLEPPVDGTVAFTGASTLEFVPTERLKTNQKYRVILEKLRVGERVLEAKQTFEHHFKTPGFGLVRAEIVSFEQRKNRLVARLVFSAPPQFEDVRALGNWSRDAGQGITARYTKTTEDNVVQVLLTGSFLSGGARLNFGANSKKVRSLDGAKSRVRGSVQIPKGKSMRVLKTHLVEGGEGFYVKVICTDDASDKGRTRWFWDDKIHESFQVSPRCALTEEEAEEAIQIKPKLKFSVSPTRGGFRILAPFSRGSYEVRIAAGARTQDGGSLTHDVVQSFSVPARSPKVEIVAAGRYLSRNKLRELTVRHMNLAKMNLDVRHVSAANLPHWLNSGNENSTANNSDLIAHKTIALKTKHDVMVSHTIDLVDVIGKDVPRGVLEIEATDPKNGSVRSEARILMTNLNLVAKHQEKDDSTMVWVLDLETNEPKSGVEITQIVRSGRALSRCTTDGNGRCSLAGVAKDAIDTQPPFALIARSGSDLTYLKYDELQTKAEDADVSGRPYTASSPYRAAIYSDRGVYRPGETAHITALIRTQEDIAPPREMPVVWELVSPRQKVAKRRTFKTNSAGMIAADFDFADFAETGRWSVRLTAGKKQLGRYGFNVEEFVPERMKVTVKPKQKAFLLTDSADFGVEAQYLFGGSAAGSTAQLDCVLRPSRFRPKNSKEYNYSVFRPDGMPAAIPLGKADGTIGEGGLGKLTCPPLDGRGGFAGPAKVSARVAVFEAGSGRSTQGDTSAMVHPERYYLGLKVPEGKVEAGKQLSVEGIVVDWDGNPKTGVVSEVPVTLFEVQREHDWRYDQSTGRYTYRQYQRMSKVASTTAKVNGAKFSAQFDVNEKGSTFVVRATHGRAQTDVSRQGTRPYWWSWTSSSQDQTPRPERAATVDVKVPKSTEVGADLPISFVPPYAGRALITLETDRVLSSKWIDVNAERVEHVLRVDEFAPNVYVSVFVVKDPHLESAQAFLPGRAMGLASVRVDPKPHRLQLKVAAPKEVRSYSELNLTVEVEPQKEPVFVTVAAVDEGILQLTKFKSPDPLAMLFDRRQLGIDTYETIGWNLMFPAGGPGGSTGGDGPGGAPKRPQAIEPVALWSGMLQVPEDGKLNVSLSVPDYRGALRVMTVAAGKNRMAGDSQQVLVRDPIVVQSTLPRFMVAGDVVSVPVFLTNTSGKRRPVEVELSLRPWAEEAEAGIGLEILGAKKAKLELTEEGQAKTIFQLKANRAYGATEVAVRIKSLDLSVEETTTVPLLPAGPRERRVTRVPLKEASVSLLPHLEGWEQGSSQTTVWVTSNPYGDVFGHLSHLIRYPYGCIEQTTSSTRPLLFLGPLLAATRPELADEKKVSKMVMAGVNRILSMQTPEGGFAYWPGGREPVAWGTAYATHMLLDAKDQRFPVPQHRVDDAVDWIERTLSNWATHGRNRRGYHYARNTEAYLHYVLAKAGKGRKGRIKKLLGTINNPKHADLEGEYMLQAALFLAGDRSHEAKLKNPDVSPMSDYRKNDWSFYSDRRRRGFMLAAHVDLFGRDGARALADRVADSLRAHRSGWYTTQELVWSVTGLGKYIGEVASSFAPPKLIGNGKALSAAFEAKKSKKGKASPERTYEVYRAAEYDELTVKAAVTDPPLFAILTTEGVRSNDVVKTGGEDMVVTRGVFTANGEPVDLKNVKLGDLLYIKVHIENQLRQSVQNVVVVDRLPAGFEIENPRLGRGGAVDWVDRDDLWNLEHMNIRDDRIELFGRLNRKQKADFVYAVRAVTAGQFRTPPVEAEAMYDPSRWARQAGKPVRVVGPWDQE